MTSFLLTTYTWVVIGEFEVLPRLEFPDRPRATDEPCHSVYNEPCNLGAINHAIIKVVARQFGG